MQTPSAVLNIGVDVAKDTIVAACSEGSFPVREVANQRTGGSNASPETSAFLMLDTSALSSSAFSTMIFRNDGVPA